MKGAMPKASGLFVTDNIHLNYVVEYFNARRTAILFCSHLSAPGAVRGVTLHIYTRKIHNLSN